MNDARPREAADRIGAACSKKYAELSANGGIVDFYAVWQAGNAVCLWQHGDRLPCPKCGTACRPWMCPTYVCLACHHNWMPQHRDSQASGGGSALREELKDV